MNEEREIAAFGHYTPFAHYRKLRNEGVKVESFMVGFVAEYRISSSIDGINYTVLKEDKIRTYSSEEIIPLPRHKARFVKFEVISNVGNYCAKPEAKGAKIRLSELSLFE